DPRLGVEQLARTNRRGSPVCAMPTFDIDPDFGLRGVLGLDEARRANAGDGAEQGKGGDEPLKAQQRTQDPSPVEPALGAAPLVGGKAALRERGGRDRGWSERGWQVAERHRDAARRS